jgi:8-hydroxy-5-deazaflavin:NADPH oxidoreductase
MVEPSHGVGALTRNRRALAIFGDDPVANSKVAELIDGFGFDVVDVGPLAESWRIQPGTPGYVKRMNAKELTAALASVWSGRDNTSHRSTSRSIRSAPR